ncbi:hypothetical protein KP509_37G059300 [Ceratopteris richardii]|uniref:Uncharacterized protein n=1 Tax=Ceratopteris richardii TaxID=49495 RepID=A0A8T2Q959_CERRI|nr:hypothetical protein KP509_37G059300 [Ceratopteris richardii]
MGTTGFVLTPHKLSMCILLQAYALPSSTSPPLPQLPLPTRHKFSLFVLQMIKAHDDFLEPSFEELARELKGALQDGGGLLISHVASRLVNFLSPEDLCTFALGLRELLATAPEVASGEDEPLMIDSNSLLGHFLRRCILAFNLLSFEGMCKLLTDLDLYRQPILMISGGQHSMQNSVSKNMDMGMHDEDQPDDDDYYFEDDSSSMERSLSNIQNQSKRESGEKTVAESFGGEGSCSS